MLIQHWPYFQYSHTARAAALVEMCALSVWSIRTAAAAATPLSLATEKYWLRCRNSLGFALNKYTLRACEWVCVRARVCVSGVKFISPSAWTAKSGRALLIFAAFLHTCFMRASNPALALTWGAPAAAPKHRRWTVKKSLAQQATVWTSLNEFADTGNDENYAESVKNYVAIF